VVVTSKGSTDRLAQLNGNRHNLWDSAWRAFESQPVHGIGPGTFEFWWGRDGVNAEFVRDVHNVYLETLAETGAIGLLLLLAFFGGLLWAAWWGRRVLVQQRSDAIGIQAGLMAVFLVFMLQAAADWMWESTAVAVFALVAIALAGSAVSEQSSVASRNATRSVGLLLAAAMAVLVMLPGLANQRQIEKSQAAFREKAYDRASAAADKAIEAESWSATAYGQKALALEGEGQLPAAREAIDHALAKEPYNWRWPLVAAQIEVKMGDAPAAAESFRRAQELRRYSPLFGASAPPVR
jgi:tetratricopeptide (TPR) repeat protein